MRELLLCAPDYYGIEYEINPWMNVEVGSDPSEAKRQWQALHNTLIDLGVMVSTMKPMPGLLASA